MSGSETGSLKGLMADSDEPVDNFQTIKLSQHKEPVYQESQESLWKSVEVDIGQVVLNRFCGHVYTRFGSLHRPIGATYPHRHCRPTRCMEFCPSPGLHVDHLGKQADPLPPELKENYQKKKAREQTAKAEALRLQEDHVNGSNSSRLKKVRSILVGPEILPTNFNVSTAFAGLYHPATGSTTSSHHCLPI